MYIMNTTILPYFESWKRSANKNIRYIMAEAERNLTKDELLELIHACIDQCNYELIFLNYQLKYHESPYTIRKDIKQYPSEEDIENFKNNTGDKAFNSVFNKPIY